MSPKNIKGLKDDRAILFPHSYLPGWSLNRIASLFENISICQPWFMDSPLPESDGMSLSFLQLIKCCIDVLMITEWACGLQPGGMIEVILQ